MLLFQQSFHFFSHWGRECPGFPWVMLGCPWKWCVAFVRFCCALVYTVCCPVCVEWADNQPVRRGCCCVKKAISHVFISWLLSTIYCSLLVPNVSGNKMLDNQISDATWVLRASLRLLTDPQPAARDSVQVYLLYVYPSKVLYQPVKINGMLM